MQRYVAAFRQGLSETGYVEGQNVAIEYRWAEGRYDRLPALAADLVGRKVDVIVASGGIPSALAAKSATSTIPIVFTRRRPGRDRPGRQSRPAGRQPHGLQHPRRRADAKRLELLSELVPQARVIALLVNPNNPNTERIIRDVQEAARAKGVQLQILKASTESEIDAAFATLVQLQPARSSSAPIRSSPAGASSSWRWHHAMPFRRSMSGASTPRPAA